MSNYQAISCPNVLYSSCVWLDIAGQIVSDPELPFPDLPPLTHLITGDNGTLIVVTNTNNLLYINQNSIISLPDYPFSSLPTCCASSPTHLALGAPAGVALYDQHARLVGSVEDIAPKALRIRNDTLEMITTRTFTSLTLSSGLFQAARLPAAAAAAAPAAAAGGAAGWMVVERAGGVCLLELGTDELTYTSTQFTVGENSAAVSCADGSGVLVWGAGGAGVVGEESVTFMSAPKPPYAAVTKERVLTPAGTTFNAVFAASRPLTPVRTSVLELTVNATLEFTRVNNTPQVKHEDISTLFCKPTGFLLWTPTPAQPPAPRGRPRASAAPPARTVRSSGYGSGPVLRLGMTTAAAARASSRAPASSQAQAQAQATVAWSSYTPTVPPALEHPRRTQRLFAQAGSDYGSAGAVTSLSFALCGRLAAGTGSGQVVVGGAAKLGGRLASGTRALALPLTSTPLESAVRAVTWSRSSSLVAACHARSVGVWKAADVTPKPLLAWDAPSGAEWTGASFVGNDRLLALSTRTHVGLFGLDLPRSRQRLAAWGVPAGTITATDATPCSRLVGVASSARTVSLLDVGNGLEEVLQIEAAHERVISAIRFPRPPASAPAGVPHGALAPAAANSVLTSGQDGVVSVWDVRSGERVAALLGGHQATRVPAAVDWVRGGVDVAVIDAGRVALYDIRAPNSPYAYISCGRDQPLALAGAPNLACLAVAGASGVVEVWGDA